VGKSAKQHPPPRQFKSGVRQIKLDVYTYTKGRPYAIPPALPGPPPGSQPIQILIPTAF